MTEDETLDARTTEAWRRVLARAVESRARLAAIVEANAQPVGSLRELDQRDPHGRFVYELAATAIGVATDHLEAWRELRQKALRQPAWAHASLLRGALETSCMCRWLVDPSKSSIERVRRGVKAQLADWRERGLWEVNWGVGRGPRVGSFRPGAERYEELLASVGPTGTEAERKKTADEFAMEASIDICDRYTRGAQLRGNGLYRLLSASAHGKQWSIVGGHFDLEDEHGNRVPGPRRFTANQDMAFVLTSCVVRTFASAVTDIDTYVSAGGAARANAARTERPSQASRRVRRGGSRH